MRHSIICGVAIGSVVLMAMCKDEQSSEKKKGDTSVSRPCAEGELPRIDGCSLACDEGWHEGPDGLCVADCPSLMTQQKDGSCALSCSADQTLRRTRLKGEDETYEVSYCARDCPGNMIPTEEGCDLPCGEGWHRDNAGACRLACPEGMSPSDAGPGCSIDAVGENKTCPNGTWDTDIEGPSPLYVDPESGSESGDGSKASPFATIAQAVAAMGDSATVYLAPGEYDEQVIVDGKAAFNLIGQCAANVVIAPPSVALTHPEKEEMSVGVVTTWGVDRVRIHGVTVRSPAADGNGIVIRHDPSGEQAEQARVDQCVVDKTGFGGVIITGGFGETVVNNTTITDGQVGIIARIQSELDDVYYGEVPPKGSVEIRRNQVEGLEVWDDTFDAVGVFIMAADQVTVSENRVSDFQSAIGMWLQVINTLDLDRNIISGLSGYGALSIIGSFNAQRTLEASLEENIIYDISAGPCKMVNSCSDIVWGVDFDTVNGNGAFDAVVKRNRIEKVAGYGVALGADKIKRNRLDIVASEFVDTSVGVNCASGSLSLSNSRFNRVWLPLLGDGQSGHAPVGDVSLRENVFAHREENPADMPKSGYLELIPGKVVSLNSEAQDSRVEVVGNLFKDNRAFDLDSIGLIILSLRGKEIAVEENLFVDNDGVSTWIGSGDVAVRDNHYLSNFEGLRILPGDDESIPAAEVSGNLFKSMKMGFMGTWRTTLGSISFENNVVVNTAVVAPDLSSFGEPAKRIRLSANYFGSSEVQAGNTDALIIEDNLLAESRMILFGQPEESEAHVADNYFDRSHLLLYNMGGVSDIENNDFFGPVRFKYLGTGIGMVENQGAVNVVHNLIRDFNLQEVQGVGVLGDGVQAVGAGDDVDSRIWLSSNAISSSDRFGVLLMNMEGHIEENMYVDNGQSVFDDIVLTQPAGIGYGGGDIDEPSASDQTPAVLTPEAVRSELYTLQ